MYRYLSFLILLPYSDIALSAENSKDQNSNDEVPALIITSGKQIETQQQATASTTVFTRKDIERLQANSVPEILNQVPGISVVQTGGAGSLTSIFLRGTNANQTLVLLDGVRLSSAANGLSRLEFLNTQQIERIEVVRGSRSTLYGSDAIGGVIQIFTRKPEQGLHSSVFISAGSAQSFNRNLNISGGNKATKFDLNASLNEQDGIDRSSDNRGRDQDHDAYRQKALTFSLKQQLAQQTNIGISVNKQKGKSEFDDVFNYIPGDPMEYFDITTVSTYLQFHPASQWSSRIELGHVEDKSTNEDSYTASNNSTFNTYRDSSNWLNTFKITSSQTVLAGLNWYEDRLKSSTDFNKTSRWNRAAFLQHRYQSGRLSTELGMRYDENQSFGHDTTYNASTSWKINPRLMAVLSYTEGFHAPTFNDLYFPSSSYYNGNPDLQPEHSKSYEIQLHGEYFNTKWSASAYNTQIKDLIVTATDSETGISQPENIGKAKIQGLELTVARKILNWRTSLNASWLDPIDSESGHVLARRTKRSINMTIDRQVGAFSAGMTWKAVSKRFDDSENTIEVPGYGLVGLHAQWKMSPSLNWGISINNLLNKDYSQTTYLRPDNADFTSSTRYGYQEAGRTAKISLSWKPAL